MVEAVALDFTTNYGGIYMALKKLKHKHYIRLELDGTFIIYKTTRGRTLEKSAPAYAEVVAKYEQIITRFHANKERLYYDHSFYLLMQQWEEEYEKYQQMHRLGKACKEFPLMARYIPNISDSLPEILCIGKVGVTGNTLAEIYESAKRCGYFGEVTDC